MIEKIEIKNFRSIKSLVLEPHELTALVGSNSAGKTNILKALNILLGETYPTERAFDKDDFFGRDTNQIITIQVWFNEPLRQCRLTLKNTNKKQYCQPISFLLTHTKNPETSFRTNFIVFDMAGDEYYGSGEARDQVSFVYVPSDRNLEKQMNVNEWTLLGKILKKVDENFRKRTNLEEENSREKSFRMAMDVPKKILESDFEGGISYKTFKDRFIEICKDNTKGLAKAFELDLEIYDPLFYYKTIQIIGKEDFGDFNVGELGSGVQNLILLSLFRTYAELMKDNTILAIEEPEIYLHPQAQRSLYKTFRELAYSANKISGTQIFYTTHNPSFVDAQHAYEIEILSKDKDEGTFVFSKDLNYLTPTNSLAEKFKIYSQFNVERNELFFANKIILVEGLSDKILWTTLLEEKWGIDLNKEGVSIIECSGKNGVVYFLGVAKLLGLKNTFAVWDEDDGDEKTEDKLNLLSEYLDKNLALRISSNLELFLGLPTSKGTRKIKNAYDWASTVDTKSIPKQFNIVRDFVLYNEVPNESSQEINKLFPEDIPF